jgi:integrase/recombinase XerD
MSELNALFDQFLKERIYLHNVTPKTAEWYRNVWLVFSRWRGAQPLRAVSEPIVTKTDLQSFVVALRERGVRPVSCNCYMRGVNAFCRRWHVGHSRRWATTRSA